MGRALSLTNSALLDLAASASLATSLASKAGEHNQQPWTLAKQVHSSYTLNPQTTLLA